MSPVWWPAEPFPGWYLLPPWAACSRPSSTWTLDTGTAPRQPRLAALPGSSEWKRMKVSEFDEKKQTNKQKIPPKNQWVRKNHTWRASSVLRAATLQPSSTFTKWHHLFCNNLGSNSMFFFSKSLIGKRTQSTSSCEPAHRSHILLAAVTEVSRSHQVQEAAVRCSETRHCLWKLWGRLSTLGPQLPQHLYGFIIRWKVATWRRSHHPDIIRY